MSCLRISVSGTVLVVRFDDRQAFFSTFSPTFPFVIGWLVSTFNGDVSLLLFKSGLRQLFCTWDSVNDFCNEFVEFCVG